jgi:hypothetical protein
VQQRAAATVVTLALSLTVLTVLAIPLTGRRILLVAAMIGGFVLLFPVPAVPAFCELDLPHGCLGITLLIVALGTAVLCGFWVLSSRSARRA